MDDEQKTTMLGLRRGADGLAMENLRASLALEDRTAELSFPRLPQRVITFFGFVKYLGRVSPSPPFQNAAAGYDVMANYREMAEPVTTASRLAQQAMRSA